MKQKIVIYTLVFCANSILLLGEKVQIVNIANENLETIEPGRASHYHCQHCHHCHNVTQPSEKEEQKPNEKEIQQMAIGALANMAQGILNIGWDPHNSQNVATNVTNIVGTFASFVAHAMNDKSINIEELLTNEEFLSKCVTLFLSKAESIKKQYETQQQ